MKNIMSYVFFLIFAAFTVVSAQVTLDDFDVSASNNVYEIMVEGAPSRIDVTDNTNDFVEGAGAMNAKYVIGEFHQWGSFGSLIYRTDDGVTQDWSVSDSLSLWIKVVEAPTHPEWMVFRIHLADQPGGTGAIEEYIYENATVFDVAGDWYNLRVPLYERPTDGSTVPNDEGFVLFPHTWGGGSYNNEQLDRDAIKGYNITAVVSGWDPAANLPADSVTIVYDSFQRFGYRAVPFIIFNGMSFPANLSGWSWGGSGFEVEAGAGYTPGTNAVKWTQGNEWGNGWTGIGWTLTVTQNMYGGWMTDSVKFKMKAQAATGALRMQFEGGGGKVGIVFSPTADDQWHQYALALRDFVYQDGTTGFDTTAVVVVGLMAEASGVAGNVVYFTDWWTGNPVFDVVPPAAPSNLFVALEAYSNLVTWTDTPGESGETYNVFYSKNPITDVTAPGVEVVELGIKIAENTHNVSHLLFSPVADSTVSYYYAIVTVDEAGNESVPLVDAVPYVNTAKGIKTIALVTPSGFAADGNLGDWAGIQPFRLFPSEGAHVATNFTVTDDADLSALVYFAADADYLYFAFDVTDDILDYSAGNSYEQDSPDLYIGLYNHHGMPHDSYSTGDDPDYHFRLNHDQLIIDSRGSMVLLTAADADYYWDAKFPVGYVCEGRISWANLATATGDPQFTPVEGYRIPFNFSFNDSDVPGAREGLMTWSPYDNDTAWSSTRFWLYTWLGTTDTPTAIGDAIQAPLVYNLAQNYPNPFNPVTTIEYSLKKQGKVTLSVYNIVGQKIATLVDAVRTAGFHSVSFNSGSLSSGIYFYRLETDGFSKIQKMILLK